MVTRPPYPVLAAAHGIICVFPELSCAHYLGKYYSGTLRTVECHDFRKSNDHETPQSCSVNRPMIIELWVKLFTF